MDADFSKIKLEIVYVEYQDLKTSFSFVELAINPRLYMESLIVDMTKFFDPRNIYLHVYNVKP